MSDLLSSSEIPIGEYQIFYDYYNHLKRYPKFSKGIDEFGIKLDKIIENPQTHSKLLEFEDRLEKIYSDLGINNPIDLSSYRVYGDSQRTRNYGGDNINSFVDFLINTVGEEFTIQSIASPFGAAFPRKFNSIMPNCTLSVYDINPLQHAQLGHQAFQFAKNCALVDAGLYPSFSPFLSSQPFDLVYVSNIPDFLADSPDQLEQMAYSLTDNEIPIIGGAGDMSADYFPLFSNFLTSQGYTEILKPYTHQFLFISPQVELAANY